MPYDKSIQSFTMFEEWNKEQEALKALAAIPRPPIYATVFWGKRVGAYIIDSLLLGIPMGIFLFSRAFGEIQARRPEMIDPVTGEADPAAMQELTMRFAGLQLRWTLAYLVLGSLYYILMHGLAGATLGKMVFGMKVVHEDHSRIGMGTAFKRALAFPIASGVPIVGSVFALLNGLWPIWDERKQSLGDKFAKTIVVEELERPWSSSLMGGSRQL